MLEPLRNPANWDNFRKAAVLVLIIWAAASAVLGIIYFFILGGPHEGSAMRLMCAIKASGSAFRMMLP